MLNEQDLRERVDTWQDLGEGLAMLEKIVEGEPRKEGREMRCGMTKKAKTGNGITCLCGWVCF